jgi:hypothetical protein
MKHPLARIAIRSAALVVAVAFGISACGAATSNQPNTNVPAGKKHAAVGGLLANGTAIGLLDQAYALLSNADHDYKGHRVHAMKCIRAAARELGAPLRGEGRGHEAQGTSDSQLRNAQGLLQQALPSLTGKPQRHVSEAIQQLTIALSIK